MSIMLASMSLGCSVRSVVTSVPPRIFREVHGLRVRSYPITRAMDNPISADLPEEKLKCLLDLRLYGAIEVHQLENLMLDQIPEPTVRQLNMGIARRIRALNHFDRITEVDESMSLPAPSLKQTHPKAKVDRWQSELVVEG